MNVGTATKEDLLKEVAELKAKVSSLEKAEKELIKAREFSKSVINSLPGVFYVINNKGKVAIWNKNFEQAFGYSAEEIAQMHTTDLFCEDEKWDITDAMVQAFTKGDAKLEATAITKSGEQLPYYFTGKNATIDNEHYLLGMGIDISARKGIEHELEAAKDWYLALFESANDAVFVYKRPLKDKKPGFHLDANEVACKRLGYTKKELLKLTPSDIIAPERRELTPQLRNRKTNQSNIVYQTTHITKNGQRISVENSSHLFEYKGEQVIMVISRDITARKRAENEILKLNSAMEQAHDGIAIFDNENRKISYVNQAYARMLGYTREELTDISYRKLNNRLLNNEHPTLGEVLDDDDPNVQTVEIEHIRKDGSLFPASVSFANISNQKGEVSEVVVVAKDITNQKQLEQEREKHEKQLEDMVQTLNRTNTQLAAANKELEAFNYSVSHDLRSPLRSVDGFSQALLEDYAGVLDGDGKNYLERVRKASQRMGQLIDDLLGLSRLTRGEIKPETVDVSAIAEEIVEELKLQDQKRKVEFAIAKDIVVEADARMLRVALNNLLGNAWKFTGKKAEAVIEFGVEDDENGNKTYFVKDNGVGFNMEYADKLFGAFQRLCGMDEFPGNGIGLATVQRVINRHGGEIWAEAEEGKGATFYFTI